MAAPMELTEMQLYKVAEKVDPDDWVTLGTRLGFDYNQIRQMKEGFKEKIRDGIFKMLVTWLGTHPNFTKPDARKFLADQFRRMNKIDLAYSLISTEVGFVAPHNVRVNNLSRHFEYEVRSFQKERELSFNVTMASTKGPVSLSSVLEGLSGEGEFANKLSTCMHVLGLRLTRMELESWPKSTLKFTVAANDEDGVKELRTRLVSKPNRFGEDLKRVICQYVSIGKEASALSIETSFSEEEFGKAIESFREEARSPFVGAVPPRVNGLEIVRLAQELDASMLTLLGLKLGFSDAEMENHGGNCRSRFEHMLFGWKSKHNPCKDDRSDLVGILESVGAVLLADKLRRGELKETEIEEQRRIYLERASAHSDLRTLIKNRPFPFMSHPRPPPAPVAAAGRQTEQPPGYVNYPQVPAPPKFPSDTATGHHEYVNTTGSKDKGRQRMSLDVGNDDYATVIYRSCGAEAQPCPPEDVPVGEEPLYDRIRGEPRPCTTPSNVEGDHTYINDVLLRPKPIQHDQVKRTSHKRVGSSTIPVIHSIDFSVLESMWGTLALYDVTKSDTGHTAGLIRLARTLDQINQTDIADTVWTALIKDHSKNEYLHRFVTGSITLLPRVITNRQDIDISKLTSLEDVLHRTKTLEYPSRIFIEAGKREDRDLIAEKLGYDWAIGKDPSSPLGNVDLLYVLAVADIAPGTTIGGAIESQRVCQDFKLDPNRIEDYFKNTLTEYVIVLKGDTDDFQKLFSVPPFDGQGSKKAGFSELILGEYLSHCIVIMTVGPQAIIRAPKSFVHYKLQSATSDC